MTKLSHLGHGWWHQTTANSVSVWCLLTVPQDYFGNVQVSVTNTGWVHVTIPLNAALDPNLISIQGLIFGMDGGSFGNLQGTTTFWIDNLEFTYTNFVVLPPTVMNITKQLSQCVCLPVRPGPMTGRSRFI